jgi:small subunit ribosomal protein S14
MAKSLSRKRTELKAVIYNRDLPAEERFQATLKLAELPRNSSKTRVRNRCALTGRPRGHHRRFNLSRVALRELASCGELPGVTKSSW